MNWSIRNAAAAAALAAVWLFPAQAQVFITAPEESEIRKTVTADVVVSDVRYRGYDGMYPAPVVARAKSKYPAELCLAADERFEDASAPSGYKMETLLLEAAGARLNEPLETQRQKIARWWGATDLDCSMTSRFERTFLPMMMANDIASYRIVDRVIAKYRLPLNDVARDGRTVLDVLADRIDEYSADGRSTALTTRMYGTLRRLGGKHRMELEREGVVADPNAGMATQIAALIAKANAGTASAALELATIYQRHPHVTTDLEKSADWLAKAEALAVANRDGPTLTVLGKRYLDSLRDVPHTPSLAERPPFTGKRERAVQLLDMALDAQYPAGSDKTDAQGELGYAYYIGFGTPQNWDRAIELLAPLTGDVFAQHRVGQMLLERGRRAEAIRHLRVVAFTSMANELKIQGTGVRMWLSAQPEGLCGPGATGIDYGGC